MREPRSRSKSASLLPPSSLSLTRDSSGSGKQSSGPSKLYIRDRAVSRSSSLLSRRRWSRGLSPLFTFAIVTEQRFDRCPLTPDAMTPALVEAVRSISTAAWGRRDGSPPPPKPASLRCSHSRLGSRLRACPSPSVGRIHRGARRARCGPTPTVTATDPAFLRSVVHSTSQPCNLT